MSGISRRDLLKAAMVGGAGLCAPGVARTAVTNSNFVHEAMFWAKGAGGVVECGLCPVGCRLHEGERGNCGVRENRNGSLVSLVYGRIVTSHVDPIEKKPFSHVLPGRRAYSIATAGCNIECKFCQNWRLSQSRPEKLPAVYMSPKKIVAAAQNAGAPIIAYTYTEPVVFYEIMYDTVLAGREKGVHSVMITNGYINEKPMRKLAGVMSAVKVDLKAFTWKFYKNVCKGELQPVLETLILLNSLGVWMEIVVLLLPGMNDSEKEIRAMAEWIREALGSDVPVHFSRFHPMYKMRSVRPTPRASLERARNAAMDEGLHYVYIGNLPGHEAESTFCPSCKTRLVHRLGYVVKENRIRDGKCPKCSTKIAGFWEDKKKAAPATGNTGRETKK